MASCFRRAGLIVLAITALAATMPAVASARAAHVSPWGRSTLFVSAVAAPGGNGSERAPFSSLAAVQAASQPGDTIVVLPAPLTAPPLDGGIALKPHQQLVGAGPSVIGPWALVAAPRVTNSSIDQDSGDAVELSTDDEVTNLEILDAARGGIYGSDVDHAVIDGNDVSGSNTSCTQGLYIYFPPASGAHHINGWAGIMVDADSGSSSLEIADNRVHDAICSDGIDVRAFGTSHVSARIDGNQVTRLAQEGPAPIDSVLAIGLQSRDNSDLTVESRDDSETEIGSTGADCEGLFTNQTGGTLIWNVDHNTFAHGIGGSSCNGGEFFTGDGGGTEDINIANSTFTDDPGDMLETNNLGTGSAIHLTIRNVTVDGTTLATPPPAEALIPPEGFITGRAFCMTQFGTGPDTINDFTMIDSRFSHCLTDGIFGFFANLPAMGLGTGPQVEDSIDIEHSTITNVGQYALHWVNYATSDHVAIRAHDSVFSNAGGAATVAVDQAPGASTIVPEIDLGGGALGSSGGNCILQGTAGLAAETTGYNAFVEHDWWGSPSGPAPSALSAANGSLAVTPFLTREPRGCY